MPIYAIKFFLFYISFLCLVSCGSVRPDESRYAVGIWNKTDISIYFHFGDAWRQEKQVELVANGYELAFSDWRSGKEKGLPHFISLLWVKKEACLLRLNRSVLEVITDVKQKNNLVIKISDDLFKSGRCYEYK